MKGSAPRLSPLKLYYGRGMRDPFLISVLKMALISLPTLGLLLAGYLPQESIHAGAGYGGLSLLAALGTMGFVYLGRGALLRACSALARLFSAMGSSDSDVTGGAVASLARPVVLLRSFFVLLSGFGGWIYARYDRGPLSTASTS